MKTTWRIRKEEKVGQKEVTENFRRELLLAHGSILDNRDNAIVTACSRLKAPTDADEIVDPLVAKLDTEYYEETLKGYEAVERVNSTRRETMMKAVSAVGTAIVGGIFMLGGMLFLDSCERRDESPTQPSRNPGFKLLRTRF